MIPPAPQALPAARRSTRRIPLVPAAAALALAFAFRASPTLAAPSDDAPAPAPSDTPPVLANTGSVRIAFAAREWLDVGLDVNGVRVERLELHQLGKFKSLFTRHDEANRGTIVVTNTTRVSVRPALAVAIIDREGRLLAAANTGMRLKSVAPGETTRMEIHFGGVFRYLERADYILLSLEY